MTLRNARAGHHFLAVSVVATLAGCASTPLGPTVAVMPGPGKSMESFQGDNAACKAYASQEVKGQADAANQHAIGTALLATVLTGGLGAATGAAFGNAGAGAAVGAAAGAGVGSSMGGESSSNDQFNIQQQYNNAFSQCMYTKHDQVPGFAPAVAYGAAAQPPDPLVRSTQSELIRLGYLKGSADGHVGTRTRDAIANFEQANGLPSDGSPSPQLLAKLQSASNGAPMATASAPHDWVTPANTSTGMAPINASASMPPAAASTASSGWVQPTK
jgi:uncharacterized protein YcfJ